MLAPSVLAWRLLFVVLVLAGVLERAASQGPEVPVQFPNFTQYTSSDAPNPYLGVASWVPVAFEPYTNLFWVGGGITQGGSIVNTGYYTYDYGHTWNSAPQLPNSLAATACMRWYNEPICIGGYTNSPTDAAITINQDLTWNTLGSTGIGGRYGHAAFIGTYNSPGADTAALFVVGGATQGSGCSPDWNAPANDVWYTTNANVVGNWQLSQAGWSPRFGHQVATTNNGTRVVLVGGMSNTNTVLNDVWLGVFSTTTQKPQLTWISLPVAISSAFGFLWTHPTGDYLYLVQGYNTPVANPPSTVGAVSLDYGFTFQNLGSITYWTNWNSQPAKSDESARYGFGALALDRQLFVVGGASASQFPVPATIYNDVFWTATHL